MRTIKDGYKTSYLFQRSQGHDYEKKVPSIEHFGKL